MRPELQQDGSGKTQRAQKSAFLPLRLNMRFSTAQYFGREFTDGALRLQTKPIETPLLELRLETSNKILWSINGRACSETTDGALEAQEVKLVRLFLSPSAVPSLSCLISQRVHHLLLRLMAMNL